MVVKKGGFFQRVGGIFESAATKVDNAVFKTDAVNSARKNLDNPEFTQFLARAAEKGGVSVEALQSGGNGRKLGTALERFEKVNTTIGRAKEVLTNQFKEQMGIDVTDADLQTVEIYFKDAAFEDPKTLDRLAATFEKGIKMQAEVAQRRGQLEALKDKFGREKLALMDMRDMGGMFGNKETRAWAREEARERGYGPIRAWMFKTFSANSAIEEKISEGSSLSMEKRREAYNHIFSAQSDVEKAEGKVHDKLITRMLKQSDFAVKAIEIARGKAMERIASAIDSPERFDVKGLVEERKRLETLAQSDFAPEDGVFEGATVVGGRDQKAEHLFEMLESSVKYRVDQIMEQLVEQLADPAVNPGFSELLAQVQSVVGDLSDGTPDGNRDARIQVAERLAQRPTDGLTATKTMLVTMVINHLSR